MTTPATDESQLRLSPSTYVTLGAAIAMLVAITPCSIYVGRQLQRIDTVETAVATVGSDVSDLRREVQEIRIDMIRSGWILPTTSR